MQAAHVTPGRACQTLPAMAGIVDLSSASVIVTGGSRGIGRGIAERFLAEGAGVVICARHAPDELPASGDREALFVAVDIRDPAAADVVVGTAVDAHGRIDVLVNNAGGAPPADAASASPRFHEAVVRLNLLAPLHVSQRANAVMQQQETGGAIINIGSVAGARPAPRAAAYGAAKAGLANLTRSLAQEWAPRVRVNCVTAGAVRTEDTVSHYGGEAGVAAVGATIPLGRMCEPNDIADACLYLVSPQARYVTGANLVLDGGGERPAYQGAVEEASRGGSPP